MYAQCLPLLSLHLFFVWRFCPAVDFYCLVLILHIVPNGRYPAINKPAGVAHWLKYSKEAENVDWVVILDTDMIVRGPILPWELGAEKGRPVAAYYG